MSRPGLQALAEALARPPAAISNLASLPDDSLQTLAEAIRHTLDADNDQLQAELKRALPGPLGALLGRGEPR